MTNIFTNLQSWMSLPVKDALSRVDYSIVDQPDALPENRAMRLRALTYFEPRDTRVVIIGQDPYHTKGKANGLCFGINPDWVGERLYSSFGNVVNEVLTSTGQRVTDYSLESWAKQGVLLLNTRLSVAENRPMSHAQCGWEAVVQALLETMLHTGVRPTWFLWGKEAQSYAPLARKFNCNVLTASHPTKYSATRGNQPFVGCRHFAAVDSIKWGE